MKSLYLLTVALSLAHASAIAQFSPNSHENALVRRVLGGEWGNRPGQRGYDYREDPDWRGNRGGRISSDQLLDEDEDLRRDYRDPSPPLRPAFQPSSSQSRPPSSFRPLEIRPKRSDQVKKVQKIQYVNQKTYPNGDMRAYEIGAQFPLPKQGINGYVKAVGGMTAGPNIFSDGRVGVTTAQTAGTKYAFGPVYVDASYTRNQDQNPAPAPRPQPVSPQGGAPPNTYYVHGSDGRRIPVYLDENGDLRSENSDGRIKGGRNVYLNNGPGQRRSKRSPDNVLGTIEGTTNAPSNSTVSLSGEWQSYYNIYTGLRTNATNLLMPIFENVVNKSNTSYAYEMVWSIHSQLTGSPNSYEEGYYMNGMANFDNFTDSWLLAAGFWLDSEGIIYRPDNSSISNDTLIQTAQMLSANDYLQTTYYATWNASVAAINVTQNGSPNTLLEDLVYYSAVVTATNDTTVLSENFYSLNLAAAAAEAAWFLDGLNNFF